MKRKLVLVGVCLALVIGIVGVTGCSRTSYPENGLKDLFDNAGIIVNQQTTGISVSGEGKVSAVPDVAILSLGVEVQKDTVLEARQQAAEAMEDVIDVLGDEGVAEKDITTQRFSIYPVTRWDSDTQEEILIGYRVTNMVTAKIREVDKAGIVIDEVAKAGGDYVRISDIDFTIDDPTAYYGEAREKAMADAKDKAERLAELAGVDLGKPIYISESTGYISVPRTVYPMEEAISVPTVITPIVSGETEISLNVQVLFDID